MSRTPQQEDLSAWDFVVKYFPGYYHSNEILEADVLTRVVEKEYVEGDMEDSAYKMLQERFCGGEELAKQACIEAHEDIYRKSIENFLELNRSALKQDVAPEIQFFRAVNWPLLKRQKISLLTCMDKLEENDPPIDPECIKDLQGIINMIDSMQDIAVDDLGMSEKEVFDNE
jgi:hypothetical protein